MRPGALLPVVYAHPSRLLLGPLVEMEAAKLVLVLNFFECAVALRAQVLDLQRSAERWIRPGPGLRIGPIVVCTGREDDRIELVVRDGAVQNLHGVRVLLVAQA